MHVTPSEQPFWENYSTLDSHTIIVISHALAYSSRWRRKPWQGLLTPQHSQHWNKSFTHIEDRAGAVGREFGREGLVNKSQSSLLNFYFRLSGFQSSLLLIHYNPLLSEYCLHCTKVWLRTYPICNAHSGDRRRTAFLRYDASSSVLFRNTKSSFLSFYSNTKSIIPVIGSWYKYFNNGNSSNLLNHTKLYQLQQLYPTTPNYTKVTLLSVKLLLAVENGES